MIKLVKPIAKTIIPTNLRLTFILSLIFVYSILLKLFCRYSLEPSIVIKEGKISQVLNLNSNIKLQKLLK